MKTVDNTPHCHHSLSSKNLFFLYHLLILLSFNSLSLKPSLASTNGLYTDSQQLLNFKASLPNANTLQNWVPNNTPCNFTGVSCRNSMVSSVNLSYTHLGIDFLSIARFLITLPNLETLLLKSTNLTGSVSPVAESQCGAVLSSVDLSDNGLSSSVSELSSFAACSSLKSLNISTNSFHFTIGSKHSNGLRLNLQVLDLSHNLISGENIVPMLFSGGCGDLRYLSLKGNKIAGAVPLSDCQTLKYLDLSDNNISSTFPSLGDCLFLEHLDLSSNKFSGDISTGLSGCERLNFLNLTKNQFSGEIPVLPGGGKLQFVYLSGNHFNGEIPLHLTRLCSSLIELDISSNNLSGTVPDTFGVCSSLESFDISNNKFSGSLPIQTLLNLTNLKTMVLSFNNFVGGLPNSLMKLTNLETLDMSSNSLSGSIPLGLCNDPRNSLKELYLQNNMFSGPVPDSLSNCSQLVSLDLSFNNLTGTIPSSLGSLSRLRDLIIWLNQLHGEIPKELMYIQTLENLILDFNELTGTIPAGLSNCTNLNWISLSNNRLSGEIPASLGRLANLAILKLGNNSISGSIPAELGDCRSLLWLDLNTNLLSGIIPPALFKQSGKIAVAALTGKRYKYIKNDGSKQCHGAGNLIEFGGIRQEQMNRISTRHPCNFTRVYDPQPTFIHNGSMIFLDLSYNMLNGSIPKELGSVYYLLILNLGHNDLSGPLPQELGGLKNVAILDLSYNRLNGSIPQSLTGLTFLGEIHLSNNNLSGMIPQSTQFNTLPDYEFLNNSGLCGWPLPSCGADSNSSWNSQHQKSHRRQASHAVSLSVVLLFALFCIVGLIIVFIETNKRRKRKDAAGLGIYMDGNSHSGTANTNWKLTSAREALSINLATFEKPLRRLTFADLVEATNGFHDDSRVGSGGFGDVYKAQLKDGSVVAIKKLIHISGQGDREFTNEMKTIGKIKHRNLVPLVGYCKVGEERLLVYEYMKYGSLDNVLHERENGITLNWAARRKIAIGAARGLTFLHHTCIPHIIHRDMKSSNVLVDQNLEARVSDFGMARLMSAMDTHLSVSTLAGTPGYVPPEYFQSFKCSTQGDVYSYGVILLELLTGKKPTQSPDFGDNNLVGWVKQHSKMRKSDVFDRELLDEDPILEIELLQYLKVANACLDDWPQHRPTMIQVMAMFKEIQAGSGIAAAAAAAATDDESFNNVGGGVEMSIEEGNEYVEQANT